MDRKKTICVINDQIIQDPILIEVMKRIFDWSNQMGLDGNKCFNLQLEDNPSIFGGYINVICETIDKDQFRNATKKVGNG